MVHWEEGVWELAGRYVDLSGGCEAYKGPGDNCFSRRGMSHSTRVLEKYSSTVDNGDLEFH